MAKKMYAGVNNVAEEISKFYVGINGVARNIKKAYVGVNSTSRQIYEAEKEPIPKIVTWVDGTDAEIVAMVNAADKGLIDLTDYWNVGDERIIEIDAIPATYVKNPQPKQNIKMKLVHRGGKNLATPTASGRTKCSFVIDTFTAFEKPENINVTNTNIGGWPDCSLRSWCNEILPLAISETLLPIFKWHKNSTWCKDADNRKSIIETIDLFSIPTYWNEWSTGSDYNPDFITYSNEPFLNFFGSSEDSRRVRYKSDGSIAPMWYRDSVPRNSDINGYINQTVNSVTKKVTNTSYYAADGPYYYIAPTCVI